MLRSKQKFISCIDYVIDVYVKMQKRVCKRCKYRVHYEYLIRTTLSTAVLSELFI